MRPGIEVLFSGEQIQTRVKELAAEIRRDHPEGVHLVAVLTGAIVFLADLMREIEGDVSVDFIAVSSYLRGRTSSGEIRLLTDLEWPVERRHVVIVEDIVDTGTTLVYLQDLLRA